MLGTDLLKYEKKAFWKFFTIYFGSVALLILASGFFYFQEQKKTLIEKEHFSMIEYVRAIKMKQNPKNKFITHTVFEKEKKSFSMDNFMIKDDKFLKYMPFSWEGGYILVQKDKKEYYKKLFDIKIKIISFQIFLLFLFAVISYFLSVRALVPMQEAVTRLDNFSKDLIHDLNTPITSILLNIKLLSKNSTFLKNKSLIRIKKSVEDISELHNNLTILLQEKSMKIQQENLFYIVNDVVQTQQRIYEDIKFIIDIYEFNVFINKNAFKQILVNLISNACKYNKKNGFVKIYVRNDILYIKDNGVGIKNPQEIFDRSYKEHSSGYGLGLDITKRLCDSMGIKIDVTSELDKGSEFYLIFKKRL